MDIPLPNEFPALPEHFDGGVWSPNVLQAYSILKNSYRYALEAFNASDNDGHRLQIHSDKIQTSLLPILEAMGPEVLNEDWLKLSAEALAGLVLELEVAASTIERVDVPKMKKPELVKIRCTGKRGRPRKELSAEWLEAAVAPGRRITLTKLAELAQVHRHTLRAYMIQHGVYERFCNIPDHDLDLLVRTFKANKPSSGLSYVVGFLRRYGLKIQRRRVRGSMKRIDNLGTVLRRHQTVNRRKYLVPHSNYLWHLDGHHKLIRWGIVIHGIVDGYCRTVVGLQASTNNTASTVLNLFLDAIQRFGVPSRMRGDRGGENIEVAVWMIKHRGAKRASFMWGSSTRNTRIERLWVEVGTQFARRWRAFFTQLERLHDLEYDSPRHLWLLHRLFLDKLNSDCRDFQLEWNLHPLSGRQNKGQSPSDIRFISQTEHGVHEDQPGVHPSILEEFYGVEENCDDDWNDVDDRITDDQASDVRHAAVEVPAFCSPFSPEMEVVFFDALQILKDNEVIPEGYGLTPDELNGAEYPAHESILLGRGGKKFSIELPLEVWWPRALLWAQGLDLMTRFLIEMDS